jgi:hypothetical protein
MAIILCGEFTKSREQLDLVKVQGSYDEYSKKVRAQEIVSRWILT